MESAEAEEQPEPPDVEHALAELGKMAWDRVDPVGEGEEWRAESNRGDHASALSFGEVLVHGSVVCQ
jgi:hypothetical protein